MLSLISKLITPIYSLLQVFQVKRFLSLCLVAVIFLTTGVGAEQRTKALTNRVDDLIHQDDSARPKTTGEWQQEAREVEGKPGKRAERIAKESADAVEDFGELYPNVVERSVPPLRDNASNGR
ncbi:MULTISPECIES: hypothetical protein [unclassified Leptolyngbya]|uniref:hypothetical protein n=1 Tax=unclassified Leptolyngbya TaxID=2650499 RepID=UPI001681D022|nr:MULTISPECIES: hypothetical protein [unclassified Leptolyngbya]MBD1910113.1 hypothetical protein [Leptolyngbya sp. FACHB-8]MBD2156885.1 hypothetical protein [Leptolyngbya sp. FACHB-16]